MWFFWRACPRCGRHLLRLVQYVRGTLHKNKRLAPQFWTYYACGGCGARLKRQHGAWCDATPDEWRNWVGVDTPPPPDGS